MTTHPHLGILLIASGVALIAGGLLARQRRDRAEARRWAAAQRTKKRGHL